MGMQSPHVCVPVRPCAPARLRPPAGLRPADSTRTFLVWVWHFFSNFPRIIFEKFQKLHFSKSVFYLISMNSYCNLCDFPSLQKSHLHFSCEFAANIHTRILWEITAKISQNWTMKKTTVFIRFSCNYFPNHVTQNPVKTQYLTPFLLGLFFSMGVPYFLKFSRKIFRK